MIRFHLKLRHFCSTLIILIFIFCFIIYLNHPYILNSFTSNSFGFDVNVNGRTPGDYLANIYPNTSYCNFRYSLPDELLYEESDLKISPQQGEKLPYRILYNIIEGKASDALSPVTYATHVTADFVNYIAEIARYWEGPISVAAFVPDYDADLTIRQLDQLCRCSPDMFKVSVHFVFPVKSPPYMQHHEREKKHCRIVDSSKFNTFRNSMDIAYPINICRNVARNTATTYFVMVADVQLIPSEKLASQFINLIKDRNMRKTISPSLVFVVPTFEVDSYSTIPRNKPELLTLIQTEKAVYFHRYVCTHCQKFPGIFNWYQLHTKKLKPFGLARRERPYHRWEPIYIGSKTEPFYNELMSWEGVQDKMSQMLEMCLMGYDFLILDGSFLVHWPGIKKHHNNNNKIEFRKENSKYYDETLELLREKYGTNEKCGN